MNGGGSETLEKLSRKKLTIDKMDNKLLENCIYERRTVSRKKCFFFCEDKGLSALKNLKSRNLFMKDDDHDERLQRA